MRQLLLFLALLVSCASNTNRDQPRGPQTGPLSQPPPPQQTPAPDEPIDTPPNLHEPTLHTAGLSPALAARYSEAVRLTTVAWEHDMGRVAPAVIIQVYPGLHSTVPCGNNLASGCSNPARQWIGVSAGRLDSLPELYHEFCHYLRFDEGEPGADFYHRDPRWDGWIQRGSEVYMQIQKARE